MAAPNAMPTQHQPSDSPEKAAGKTAAPKVPERTAERLADLTDQLAAADSSGRWLVLTHDNPDPDALVSAMILARILRHTFHRRVTCAYGGLIGRAENRALFNSLKLSFSRVRHLNFNQYRHFALVDAQHGTGNSQLPDEIVPDLIVDHHPLRKQTRAVPFHDVRPDYGATATILAEYLLATGDLGSKAMATGLIYAIRAETGDFARESAGPDKEIYDRFLPRANKRLLGKIQNAPLPPSYFHTLHQALERLEAVDTLVVSHLGPVDQPDIVPEVADLLLRMEGRTWSLVTGRFEERIYLSIRTTNPRAAAGSLMRRLVGRRGKGGGHGMIAGGWVALAANTPAAALDDPGPLPQQRQLAARLAKALKKNPDRIAPVLDEFAGPARRG